MPAVLQQWIEKSEERNRRIQQLRNEVTEIMELNVMDVTYRMLVEFLADEGIEHISEMDYILRKNYEVYMSELVKGNIVSRYLRIFDKVKQEYIRKRMETPMGRMECQWTYKNAILFIPYHSDQKIVQSVERVKNRSNMVWNFQIDSSEKMKRQIFDVLEFILENYEPSRVREQKLTGLHIFYEFCRLRKIEDINCLEQVQEDCLYRRDNQDMVIIYQPKSRRFEKPVSAEVAQLIKKAIVYAEQNYKESIYIFANKDNPQKPLNYQTLREKVMSI